MVGAPCRKVGEHIHSDYDVGDGISFFDSSATRIPPDLLAGSVLRPFLGLYGLVLECTSYVVCVYLSFLFVCLLVWFSLVASCFFLSCVGIKNA